MRKKVIEVMTDSTKSWEDATQNAIERAAKSVDNTAYDFGSKTHP